ncbi:putative exosome complex exonuclease, putative,ribosomal RNA processing protein 4 [Trypanosoma conorhini]|uniref:Putative exosome complex exonuclease, putative,ribosomal RNA processing protein 4 n=1 Tax=Trypanosoma conorhini TaxID=83891 RepID=A0A3R7N817_9TRYP|nr:putative exosome complex exonuclease, putative,ribosomal RNA processing protein 4 [Trypanosoma conorhini]RNF26962.1 putative exosome complex exonuclease, putative,ribosomal RNA processing protein 4 [Trypanosoma conorhini]
MSITTCIVGDSICGSLGDSKLLSSEDVVFLRGYSTYEGDRPSEAAAAQEGGGEIIAAINGLIEVTDRVVSVKGMSTRYHPEIGDIVIGRVKEISGNRWRIDICAYQEAVMLLSNATEPGGILRRRGRSDELTMRNIFDQDELVVAEVQRISPEGVVSLHTRSGDKYGRLTGFGVLVLVSPALVKRVKHHFLVVDVLPVSILLGTNGMIWVAPEMEKREGTESASCFSEQTDVDVRRSVARVANCIKVMNCARLPIFAKTIDACVKASIDVGLGPFEVLHNSNYDLITTAVMEAITARKRQRQ